MYSVSQNFIDAIKQSSRKFKCKVLIGAVELTEQSVIDFTIENQLAAEGLPSIGGTLSSRLNLKLLVDGITPTYFTTQSIRPSIGIEVTSGIYEYIPLGVFKVDSDSIKKTDKSIEIECFDNFVFLDTFAYESELVYPNTLKNVLTEIQTNTGFTFKNLDTLASATVKFMPIGSVRAVIGDMAELLSTNAIFDRNGLIEFRMLSDSEFSLDANNYFDFKLTSDAIVNITRLEAIQRGTDNQKDNSLFSGTNDGFTLIIDNESINTQESLNEIYNKSYPIAYYPYELTLQGMPQLEVGDSFTLTDAKGTVRSLPIISHTLTYNGGLGSKFSAGVPKGAEVKSGSTGANSITQSVNNITAKVYSVEELLAGNLTADNIQANSITAQKLNADVFTAVDGRIESLTAGFLQADDVVALNANIEHIQSDLIDTNNIVATKASIELLNSNVATINDLIATKASITNLNATNANVTNLTTDKANVTDLTATNIRTTNLETRAAAIDTLVAGNIDATNIKAGTIGVGSAIIVDGAIGSAKISSLEANKITSGIIDTSKVTIQGASARMKLTGNRLQVFAAKPDLSLYERVSLGDVNGDGSVYGFRVRGADGVTTLLDEIGVKREGITDGSINNAKIGSDANISGSKLDIASVVTSINNGTTTIDSSKIYLDDKTLAVGFGSLANTVGTQGTTIADHTSSIAANASAIALKVATSTYTTKMDALDALNATTTATLASHSASIVTLTDSITSTVSMSDIDSVQAIADNAQASADDAQNSADLAQETANNVETALTSVTTRMSKAESSITQNASSIVSKVDTSTFNALSGIVAGHTSSISQFDDKIAFSVASVASDLTDAKNQISAINSHMTFDANGLVIGQENGITDNLKVQIKSTEMNFLDNGKTVAKITGQQMDITQAKITKSLAVGQHIIETYNSDITLIKWIGGGV